VELLLKVRQAAPGFVDLVLEASASERRQVPGEEQAPPTSVPLTPGLIEPLSERELEVLELVAQGLSNRQIAERLFITVGTVKSHAHNIYGKLAVQRRTEAIARARELGLV
jgi:LuxR family maltose regulon positive regulatory protein